jgi:hypothetical protein
MTQKSFCGYVPSADVLPVARVEDPDFFADECSRSGMDK